MPTTSSIKEQGRVKMEDRLLKKLKAILKEQPITEVVGKLDLPHARCCSDGTYAIVKIDPGAVMKKTTKKTQ